MSVSRRFSDFLGLHDKLSEKYLQNGRIIPPAPDKSIVGMTKVKMGKETTAAAASNGVEEANGGATNGTASMPDEASFRPLLVEVLMSCVSGSICTRSANGFQKSESPKLRTKARAGKRLF